ncbi:pyroglutamyl-peptidase I [Entomohabitans teleogrylli]|uniref:pyroglutamyl-peptidase I n=1 Tax=Entomohabitans teleogrylli TaxID=1384589 RepID=UPI00073D9B7A|nr:pyroglutamyl-peptidase I [Entomohabitans teleogrylli]
MSVVLITGFEPFGGEDINPSWEVVRQLHQREIAGSRIVARQLPCTFGDSLSVLNAAIDEFRPRRVLAVGQAGGRAEISVERVAININDARIADNRGQQPIDTPVIAGGPAAWFSTLPVKAMVAAMRQAGIPAAVSQSAGTFVCNHVMYGVLHKLQDIADAGGGFIHVPYLPEQAVAHSGAPSMTLGMMREALEIAITVALTVDQDVPIVGGTTH